MWDKEWGWELVFVGLWMVLLGTYSLHSGLIFLLDGERLLDMLGVQMKRDVQETYFARASSFIR